MWDWGFTDLLWRAPYAEKMNQLTIAHPLPRTVDIDSIQDFDRRVAHAKRAAEEGRPGGGSMTGWHVQSVDLTERGPELKALKPSGAVFLGCILPAGMEQWLRARGALIFPILPGVPFDAYRGALYSPQELFAGIAERPYEGVPDALIYAWAHTALAPSTASLDATLAAALHDYSIGTALDQALRTFKRRKIVGIMGGHGIERGMDAFAQTALMGRKLAQAGFVVATGGGPGAMEASNFGAYLSSEDDDAAQRSLETLASVPSFRPSVSAWARAAWSVLEEFPTGVRSVGIPTWFYGHEPPNLFATDIAKYFANSVREAVLLDRSRGGVVFMPGAAGTVQEIFQDACENYYGSASSVAPMVLVGAKYWTEQLPAWPLLESLAKEREMEPLIALVDSVEEAVNAVIHLNNRVHDVDETAS